jgi:hypothetical protein
MGYFTEGAAQELGEEVVPEPAEDEAIVFQEFFAAGLQMPPQPVLADILVKFRVQLHQLTPNAFAQFSKYFWVVMSCGGVPSSDGFTKCYKLHYQPKKVEIDGNDMFQQFGYLNFHTRCYQGIGAKLTLAVENMWSSGWTRAWFYCKVPAHVCAQEGKAVHVMRSYLCGLGFRMEPPFDCADEDSGDVTFVKDMNFIGGREAVEEYMACGMYPLSASISFERVTDSVTPVSRLKLPLPKFHAVRQGDEDDVLFLVRVELEAEGVVGSYTHLENDVCMAGLPNGGRLNWVFELADVLYGSRPVPSTDAFTEASRKRKMDAAGKMTVKRAKAAEKKKAESVNIAVPWAKAGSK